MLFVTGPMPQYLLENSLSTRRTTKVSLALGMFSCVKVLCVTTTIKNITEIFKQRDLILLILFQFKQLRGSVIMALNPLYRIYYFSKLSISYN